VKRSLLERREAVTGARELLLECHERIRRFTALAEKLAAADAPAEELGEAARSLVRYFSLSLPLHVQDEDLSLRPRLERVAEIPELADMSAQHEAIEARLAELIPRWQRVAEGPSERDALRETLASGARALADQMDAHLALEERAILPAMDRLAPAELDAIAAEMRARRIG